jgi:peptide/nickel transport system permease protein
MATEIKRFMDFLKIFRRNKRGMLGVAIIGVFVIVAIAAPILTPYSPTEITYLPKTAYRLSKPAWYKYLFPNENMSENIDPIQNPHFNTASDIEDLEFKTTLTSQSAIGAQFASDKGFPEGSGPGSAAVKFEREASVAPYGQFEANLTKTFNYPYSFPPMQFQGAAAILVDNPQNTSLRINVVLEKVGSENRITWVDSNFKVATGGWLTPYPLIDSDNYYTRAWLGTEFGEEWSKTPIKQFFTGSGNYRFGVEITINDTNTEATEVTVYVDDLFLRIFGNSFGLLGTDEFGRDVFTQLAYGARVSLLIGMLTATFTTVIGLAVGLSAGYIGGLADQLLMRLTDTLLVIPEVPLLIVLMFVLKPTIWTLIFLMTLLGWTGFARISRSQALSLKERPFVEAAKAVGGGKIHIIIRHILPNVMSLVYVALATAVPYAIINEAWLAWLGLYDPYTMTWGRMLNSIETEASGIYMWWWVIPPGICIAAISLSFILMGYALDEILNPKLRERR